MLRKIFVLLVSLSAVAAFANGGGGGSNSGNGFGEGTAMVMERQKTPIHHVALAYDDRDEMSDWNAMIDRLAKRGCAKLLDVSPEKVSWYEVPDSLRKGYLHNLVEIDLDVYCEIAPERPESSGSSVPTNHDYIPSWDSHRTNSRIPMPG